jgi:Fe(3+) dicitrate transport protein
VKLGYASELSNETYLGLTDTDFDDNPFRRYRASQLDRMEWERTQFAVEHTFSTDRVKLTTTVYRHDMTRSWRKVNSMMDASGSQIELFDVLQNPTSARNRLFYEVLVGNETTDDDISIRIGTNRRNFVSEGVQMVGTFDTRGPVAHSLEYGARYHYDEIIRRHDDGGFLLRDTGGSLDLVTTGAPLELTTHNRGSTHAVAFYIADEITWSKLTLSPGLRVELIRSRLEDRPLATGMAVQAPRASVQHAFLPGVGAFYALTEGFGALVGVHRGFSPVSPGQVSDVRPETSINYEAGVRAQSEQSSGELIGFFNDYDNLTPECAFSQGCADADLDQQFKGGEVNVFGVEAALSHEFTSPLSVNFPLRLSYTFTRTEVVTGFVSANPQLSDVQPGDELPYVPPHQLSGQAGARTERWATHVALTHVAAMREQAGQGPLGQDEYKTDASTIIDVAGQFDAFDNGSIYAKVDNLLGSAFVASRRPFGARPLSPRLFQFGLKYSF